MKLTADLIRESIEFGHCTTEELAKLQVFFSDMCGLIDKIIDTRAGWDKALQEDKNEHMQETYQEGDKIIEMVNAIPIGSVLMPHIHGVTKNGHGSYMLHCSYHNWTFKGTDHCMPTWFHGAENNVVIDSCDIKNAVLDLARPGNEARSCTVCRDGELIIQMKARAKDTCVNSAGSMTVRSGGVADCTDLGSGAKLTVSSGGMIMNTDIHKGATVVVHEKGAVLNASLNGNLHVTNATARGVSVKDGRLYVNRKASVEQTYIGSAGFMTISSDGVARDTSVDMGHTTCEVSSGGRIETMRLDSGATLIISSGAVADEVEIMSGASVIVHSGGVLQNMHTHQGSKLYVNFGGIVK